MASPPAVLPRRPLDEGFTDFRTRIHVLPGADPPASAVAPGPACPARAPGIAFAMFGTLNTLLRLPRQMGEAMQAATDIARSLPALQRAVTERLASVDRALRGVAADLEAVRATIEPQHERVAAIEGGLEVLPALAEDLERVRATVEPQHARVATIESGLDVLPGLAAEVERIRATIEPQHGRVAAIESGLEVLPALAEELVRVRETIEPQHERVEAIQHAVGRLEERLAELQRALRALEGNVEEATELLPDPDAPGPLARARDTLTGRS